MDGIIYGELDDSDLEMMKRDPKAGTEGELMEGSINCDGCGKSFKTKNGLNIHKAKMHSPKNENVDVVPGVNNSGSRKEDMCISCNFIFKDSAVMEKHLMTCGEKMESNNTNSDKMDYEIVTENDLEEIQKLKKHHEEQSNNL